MRRHPLTRKCRMTQRAPKTKKDSMIYVRIPGVRAEMLQLVADSETGGNVSALVRELIETKIDERLRRRRSGWGGEGAPAGLGAKTRAAAS